MPQTLSARPRALPAKATAATSLLSLSPLFSLSLSPPSLTPLSHATPRRARHLCRAPRPAPRRARAPAEPRRRPTEPCTAPSERACPLRDALSEPPLRSESKRRATVVRWFLCVNGNHCFRFSFLPLFLSLETDALTPFGGRRRLSLSLADPPSTSLSL
jgi:hypothetical protein